MPASVVLVLLAVQAPTITSISPNRRDMGTAGFTLTVLGSGFRSNATVRWNGNGRATTYVRDTELRATIPASDLINRGTAEITVNVPGGQGGVSNPVAFTVVGNPVPAITSLSPGSTMAGGETFTLTVNGSDFVSASEIHWNGSALATTYGSATRLTASVAATAIALPDTVEITVVSPMPGGGASEPLAFLVPHLTPTITGLSPTRARSGGSAFTMTVTGTGFTRTGSAVRVNGAQRTTTWVSRTRLQASIPASDLEDQGEVPVTVSTRLSRDLIRTSDAAEFQIDRLPAQTGPEWGTFLSGASLVNTLDCDDFGERYVMVGVRGKRGQALDHIQVGCSALGTQGLGTDVRWTARWDRVDDTGVAFERVCASGSAVSGFEGTLEPLTNQVRSMQLRCRPLARHGLTTGTMIELAPAGGTTSSPWGPTDCTMNRPARAIRAGTDVFKPAITALAPWIVVGVQLSCEQPEAP